jgi:L-rhamnose mutarotase
MPRILFEVNYNIYPEKRSDYFILIGEMKKEMEADGVERYYIFEDKKRKNNFSEVTIFKTEEDFEKFDENQSEKLSELTAKLMENYIVDKKVNYSIKFEV